MQCGYGAAAPWAVGPVIPGYGRPVWADWPIWADWPLVATEPLWPAYAAPLWPAYATPLRPAYLQDPFSLWQTVPPATHWPAIATDPLAGFALPIMPLEAFPLERMAAVQGLAAGMPDPADLMRIVWPAIQGLLQLPALLLEHQAAGGDAPPAQASTAAGETAEPGAG